MINRLTRDIRPYEDLRTGDDASPSQIRRWWGDGTGNPHPEPEYHRLRVSAPIYTGKQWLGGVHQDFKCVTDAMSHDMARLRYVPVDGNWGGARRQVRGGTAWSTHAFLCATDTHAPQNPMSRTFVTDMPPSLIDAWLSIRTVATGERALIWGGFWSRSDAMHTNVNVAPSALRQGVRTSDGAVFTREGGPALTKVSEGGATGVYALGSKDAQVFEIQRLLITAGLLPVGSDDGAFGPQTESAVVRWQRQLGITADGVWGPATEAATRESLAKKTTVEVAKREGVANKDEADKLVTWSYRRALGRPPDGNGLSVWSDRLLSGEATAAELYELLKTIPEGQKVMAVRLAERVTKVEEAVKASFVERFGVLPTNQQLTHGVTEITSRLELMTYE